MYNLALIVGSFLSYLSTGLLLPLIIDYGRTYGQMSLLLLSFALYPIAQGIATPIWSVIATRYSLKHVILLTTSVSSLLLIIQGICLHHKYFFWFILFRISSGMLDVLICFAKSIVLSSSNSKALKHLGLIQCTKPLGYTLGPLIFSYGIIVPEVNHSLFFYILALSQIIISLIIYFNKNYTNISQLTTNPKSFKQLFKEIFSINPKWPFGICLLAIFTADALFNAFPLVFIELYQYNIQQISTGLSLFALGNIIANLIIIPKLFYRFATHILLQWTILGIIINIIILLLFNKQTLYTICILSGAYSAIIATGTILIINKIWNQCPTKYISLFSSCRMLMGSSSLLACNWLINNSLNPLSIILIIAILIFINLNNYCKIHAF